MKLERLRVDRLNGLPAFELTRLSPRLNLLVGPNGSGKSSVLRVLRACLWPERAAGLSRPQVRAHWRLGDREAWCDLDPEVRWYDPAGPAGAPDVPPPALASCWSVGLADLLDASTSEGERDLLREVRTLMAGGYDLPRVRAELVPPARPGLAGRKRLDAARARLRILQAQRDRLAEQEDGQAALEAELRAAADAEVEARAASLALERLDRRREAAALDDTLAAFPPGMDRVDPDDLAAFDRAVERHDAQRERVAGLEREVEALKARRANLPLPAGPVDEEALQAWSTRLRELERLEARRRELSRALEAAGRVEAQARAGLSEEAGEPALDPERLEALDDWLRRRHQVRLDREAAERRAERAARAVAASAPSGEGSDRRTLQAGLDRLDDWLRAPPPPPAWLRALALTLLVLGTAASWWLTPWAVAAAGVGLGLFLAGGAPARGRAVARAGFPPGAGAPERWSIEAVRGRREALVRALADLEAAERDAARRTAEAAEAEEAAERARVEEAQIADLGRDLARGLGLRLPDGTVHAVWLVDRLLSWVHALGEVRRLEAELDALGAEHAPARAALADWLSLWGAVPAGEAATADVAALVAAYDALATRSRACRALVSRLEDAEARTLEARAALGLRRDDLQDLLARHGLTGAEVQEARAAVAGRVARLEGWREALQARHETDAALRMLDGELAPHPRLAELDGPALRRRLEEARARAATRDALATRLGELRGALERERASSAHEEALGEVAEAVAGLEAEREAHLHRVAGDLLLEDVAEAHAAVATPAVFERMVGLFQAFSHHRYTLEVPRDERAAWFVARDARTGQALRLEELSDGTRMQLRLAARIAFAEHQEAGSPLPLVLDESLTATDAERFGAVAEAVLSLGDRQVFYLTSNEADVRAWEAAAAAAGVTPRILRLGEAQRRAAAVPPEALALALPEVPAPGELSPEAYGARLGVPLPDPWAAPGALPTLHLLRDRLDLVHRLAADLRILDCGALENLLDHLERGGLDDPLLTVPVRRMLRGRLAAARRAQEAWRVGRGRPLTPQAVLDSGALTSRYHDAVAPAIEAVEGDPQRLLDAVRARDLGFKGLHGAEERAEALEAELEARGHLDRRAPLPTAVILAKAAEAAGEALPPAEARRLAEALLQLFDRTERGRGTPGSASGAA